MTSMTIVTRTAAVASLLLLFHTFVAVQPAYAATGTTFAEAGATLNLDLMAAVSVTIVSNGTSYTLTLDGANTWSGTNGSNVRLSPTR